jgi:hypothetical protein
MEIQNQKIFTCGEGEQRYQIYFTIDLIPISVVFKYDFVTSKSQYHNLATNTIDSCSIQTVPKMIGKIYTMDVYQSIIDLVCEKLSLEKRNIMCLRENQIPDYFNFSKDESFLEFQFEGNSGRSYFIETKIHHALKYWEQFKKLSERNHENRLIDETDNRFYCQFSDVRKFIDKQGIFTNRDFYEISKSTMDNFIKNLGKR